MKIKEVVVVEGKDDIRAVKEAVDCEVIATGGVYISQRKLSELKSLSKKTGIIVLTDPDYAGKRIRNIISKTAPNCKHAYILRDRATKDGDIGVENAKPEEIEAAIKRARPEIKEDTFEFTINELNQYGLTGRVDSKKRREILSDIIGIGYCNAKQLLKKLSSFGIDKEEFEKAANQMLKRVEDDR